jgi:hypothetical protein
MQRTAHDPEDYERMNSVPKQQRAARRPRKSTIVPYAIAAAACLASLGAVSVRQDPSQNAASPTQSDGSNAAQNAVAPTLEETRLVMGKWIETQQILSKERNEWQQEKEILANRLDLLKKEIATLDEKTKEAEKSVAETNAKHDELTAQEDELAATSAELERAVGAMEADVKKLFKSLPEPVTTKLAPLYQRIPEDSANTRVTVAERFQNVLGILNELNKTNTEITVSYEVRELADGKPSEVRVMYVGLTQAYYVSARGEAGIGRPASDGWKWEPSKSVATSVSTALEIIQGKQSPAFVPLPVKLQ